MIRNRFWVVSIAAIGLAAGSAQAVNFYLHDTLDLSSVNNFGQPLFSGTSPYGNNPSAVAYDGSSLWIAGFNNGVVTASVGIVRINDPWGSPAPQAVRPGLSGTAVGRGYSGLALDIANDRVYAAYDPGAAHPEGISAFKISDNSSAWTKNARGGSGVATDPGFSSVDSGAAWTTFGSGRRALQNASTGADIYTTSDGMIINVGTGTFWRDMAFAPDGDVWARRSNGVIWTNRTGGNSGATPVAYVAPVGSADFVNGQNIAYLDGAPGGDLVIYNDRPSTAFGQIWELTVKALNAADGSPATINFLAGNGDPLPFGFGVGAGYFDFAWNAANQELIGLDFANRLVYRFKPVEVPEPTTLLLVGAGVVGLLRRRR